MVEIKKGNMNSRIYKMDLSKCIVFLESSLKGWGIITKEVLNTTFLNCGSFYCIAPSDITAQTLYAFDEAKGMSIAVPYPEDIIVDETFRFLQSESKFLIIEDVSSDFQSEFVKKSDRIYFLVNDIIFYRFGSNTNKEIIEQYYRYAKGYGFCPILVEGELDHFDPYTSIGIEYSKKIAKNMKMFFTPIYDFESYLIWCHDDYYDEFVSNLVEISNTLKPFPLSKVE